MSKKHKYVNNTNNNEYFPENLDNHIFHGLVLDDDQKYFRDCIWSDDYDIIFCDAKAGTGKTLVSIATALLLYHSGKYPGGIVYVVSPVQETKLGFLPGNPEEKISPYIEPVRSALRKVGEEPEDVIIQDNKFGEGAKQGNFIDCISHVYLRGCNIDEKVVIIDEAQNMYLDELRKTLTRNNKNTKIIVIGHHGQCDIYKNPMRSGFAIYKEWYRNKERAAICELKTVHRGWVAEHADKLDTVALCEYIDKYKIIDLSTIDLTQFEIKD